MSKSFPSFWTMEFNKPQAVQPIMKTKCHSKNRTNRMYVHYKILFIKLIYSIGLRKAKNPPVSHSMNLDAFTI